MLPNLIGSHVLSKTVVVTDVLRASTTICSALAHGARSIVPFVETDQAKSHSDSNGEKFLCGGERGGLPIGGFDLAVYKVEDSPLRAPDVVRYDSGIWPACFPKEAYVKDYAAVFKDELHAPAYFEMGGRRYYSVS